MPLDAKGVSISPLKGALADASAAALQLEVLARDDVLRGAFARHRTNKGGILLEKEMEAMLVAMAASGAHSYGTTAAQVKEFLWAEMNMLGDDSDEEEEEEEEGGEGEGGGGAAAGAAAAKPQHSAELAAAIEEAQTYTKLVEVYNRMVDNQITLARLKSKLAARSGEGGNVRKARTSRAFQGEIGADGTVGDTGEIAGYDSEEEAVAKALGISKDAMPTTSADYKKPKAEAGSESARSEPEETVVLAPLPSPIVGRVPLPGAPVTTLHPLPTSDGPKLALPTSGQPVQLNTRPPPPLPPPAPAGADADAPEADAPPPPVETVSGASHEDFRRRRLTMPERKGEAKPTAAGVVVVSGVEGEDDGDEDGTE